MFDDEDGVPPVAQAKQNAHELFHVVARKPRRRLVQNIHRLARGSLRKLRGKFHSLRLAARERRRALPELDIPEPHLVKGGNFIVDGGHGAEKFARFLHRHVEDVGNGLALVAHFERFAVVALAAAHFAGDVDVGQKVHLDLHDAVARAVLAPPARDVEGKSARLEAHRLGVGGRREQLADGGEDARVCCGIGARRAADGRLVDGDDFIEIFDARVRARLPVGKTRPAEAVGEDGQNDLVDEGGLARTAHARDRRHEPHGDTRLNAFQIVLAAVFD